MYQLKSNKMEKLIKDFEDLFAQETYQNKEGKELLCNDISTVVSMECKKIAIAFANYSIEANVYESNEELFNKFIEEEYGK